jgi:hypothetical protein
LSALSKSHLPSVDQTFSRLVKAGKLLHVARGTYVAPLSSRSGTRPPAPEKVIESMAEQSGEIVVPHGANAANFLPRWMLALGASPAGAAVRALAWMGLADASEALATLRRTLPRAEWRVRAALSSWMAKAIGSEAARGRVFLQTHPGQSTRGALEQVRAETVRPFHLLEKDLPVVWTLRALFTSLEIARSGIPNYDTLRCHGSKSTRDA